MISVCMATFNGCRYIKEQVDSILGQLGEGDELIVSDDGSTDGTLEILGSYKDYRIKILHHVPSSGCLPLVERVTSNFENALKAAKGDMIFMSDQDDVWRDDKVKIMSEYLKTYDYVVSDCYVTDSDLNVVHDTRFYKGSGLTRNRWKALFAPTPYQGSCAAFRRSVLERALPFPPGIQSHDRWVGFVASFFYKYIIIDEPLVYYRRHTSVVSSSTSVNHNSAVYKIRTRIRYIVELLKRI